MHARLDEYPFNPLTNFGAGISEKRALRFSKSSYSSCFSEDSFNFWSRCGLLKEGIISLV